MKIKSLMFFAGMFLATFLTAVAQDFEGKIVYSISYPKLDNPEIAGMLPKESVMYIKGDKVRVEANSAMGKNVTISDAKDKKSTILMDMLGQKIAMATNESDTDKDNPYKDAKVTITDETKTIAGYKCTKAIIETKEAKDGKLELYFTKDLGTNASNAAGPFKQIEGAVLEYGIVQQGMNMKFMANTVSKEKVADSKFVIPEGYSFMTRDDLMKMMGGGK